MAQFKIAVLAFLVAAVLMSFTPASAQCPAPDASLSVSDACTACLNVAGCLFVAAKTSEVVSDSKVCPNLKAGGGLSGAAIAGIVICVIAGVAIIVLVPVVYIFFQRHKKAKEAREGAQRPTAMAGA